MRHSPTRRDFLKTTTLTTFGILLGARGEILRAYPANEKLSIGVVGVANRAAANLGGVSSQTVAGLCDVDDRYLGEAAKRFPAAEKYNDFRRLIERKDIDAIVVSTPDHTHAVASLAAVLSGKHIYCEKPLAHSVYEVRAVTDAVKKHKRASQLGTQIHAVDNYRRVVELIEKEAIGKVREAHVWCGKCWGGGERPKETPPVPDYLHYDLWLGPAPYRPYHPVYLPGNWRRWWDFGGGTLADMGCHYMDLVFWALKLAHPLSAEATGSPVHPETAAMKLQATWRFPARGALPAVELTWYDGGLRPAHFKEGKLPQWGDGVLFVGEKGMLIADYNNHRLLPEKDFEGFQRPDPYIPPSKGHYEEWLDACKGKGEALCHFGYSGPLTETVLLGLVAYRSGKKIQWDAARLKSTNHPEVENLVRPPLRDGWTL